MVPRQPQPLRGAVRPPPRPHGFKDPLVPASGKECFLEPQATISFFQKLIPKENQKHQLSLVS